MDYQDIMIGLLLIDCVISGLLNYTLGKRLDAMEEHVFYKIRRLEARECELK